VNNDQLDEEAEIQLMWKRCCSGWSAILTHLLGRTEVQVKEFTDYWKARALDPNGQGIFFHRYLEWYVTSEIMRLAKARPENPDEERDIADQLEWALRNGQGFQSYDSSYDWQVARERVERILNTVGGSLD
jgi:hypothetical protein